MNKLHNLISAGKKRKRVGRGGDRGGTSGRGHQGQGSRSGGSIGVVFEGGQMPLSRRLPKRGFSNALFKKEYVIVNLDRLNEVFDAGAVVTKKELRDFGLIKNEAAAVKILGAGQLDKKLVVHADAFSASAKEAITKVGGEAHLIKEM